MFSSNQNTLTITRFSIAVFVIITLGSIIRLYNLDYMAFHHDESIHAYYSFREFQGDFYRPYDPTYHGQFLYHFGALFFLLFGDSDFVGRLPFVTLGILMLYFVWRLKPWLGNSGVIAALLFASLSPSLSYFSRFARHDIYMGTFAMGTLVFALEYLRSPKNKFLVLMSFFLALLYCCKEDSYMYGFMFGSFAVFYGVHYYFSYAREIRSHAVYEIFQERSPFVKILTLYALFSCTAFSLVFFVSHQPGFRSVSSLLKSQRNEESFSIQLLNDTWLNYMQTHPWLASWGIRFWILTPLLLAIFLFFIYGLLARFSAKKPLEGSWFSRFAQNNLAVVSSLLVIFALYTAMFTNFGAVPQGMKSGVIDYLLYWMGQQGAPRIPGPPDYYLPRLLIYEPVLVLFCFLAFLIYTWNAFGLLNFFAFQTAFLSSVYVYWTTILTKTNSLRTGALIWLTGICISLAIAMGKQLISLFSFVPKELQESSPKDTTESRLAPDGFRAFLLYWSILSVLIFALLNEKVPWLLVPQVVPLALLAGVFVGDLFDYLKPGLLRHIFVFIISFFVLYACRTSILLNWYNPDNPRELMIFTQTDHSAKDVVTEIREAARKLGPDYLPPNPKRVIVSLQGNAIWPYVWYFRDYLTTSPAGVALPPPDVPFALTDAKAIFDDNMKVWAKGKYTKRTLVHRGWWPPALGDELRTKTPALRHELPFGYAREKNNQAPSAAWKMLWNYILYRQIWDPRDPSIQPVGEYIYFYARSPLIEPLESPLVPGGYDLAVQPLRVIKMVGKFGHGNAEFIEPRGVALSPDQSRLYVLDAKNGRIQVFDTDLNFLGSCGSPGTGLGQFLVDSTNGGDGPNGGISIGPDGTIFATDSWSVENGQMGRINRYNSDGQPLLPLTPSGGETFYFPRGLTVAHDGTLYVADTGYNRVVKFNPDGTYAGAIVQGQLSEPVGITLGVNGWIYVCDVGMKRIAAFTPQGMLARQWMVMGWQREGEYIFSIEPYVTLDQNGNIFVTDSTKQVIHRFDANGKQVTQMGGEGGGVGQLRGPKGITIDSKGNLYIADSFNNRIVKARGDS